MSRQFHPDAQSPIPASLPPRPYTRSIFHLVTTPLRPILQSPLQSAPISSTQRPSSTIVPTDAPAGHIAQSCMQSVFHPAKFPPAPPTAISGSRSPPIHFL